MVAYPRPAPLQPVLLYPLVAECLPHQPVAAPLHILDLHTTHVQIKAVQLTVPTCPLNCGGPGLPLSWTMALALPRLLVASQL